MEQERSAGAEDKYAELQFAPQGYQRFETDSPGGPSVAFAYRDQDDVGGVVVMHRLERIVEEGTEVWERRPANNPAGLVFTPAEWHAFCLGVSDGEFDHLPQGYMRDSKDPDGTVLVVQTEHWGSLLEAVKSGKYNLPAAQAQALEAEFADAQQRREELLARLAGVMQSVLARQAAQAGLGDTALGDAAVVE